MGLDALASLLGAGLGSLYVGKSVCECRCSVEHDTSLIALLRDQLARCGPLRVSPCTCSPCIDSFDGWHAVFFAAGFVAALLTIGCLGAALRFTGEVLSSRASSPGSCASRTEHEPAGSALATTPASWKRALLP